MRQQLQTRGRQLSSVAADLPDATTLWVIDSCSLFNVRRDYARDVQRRIWTALGALARADRLKWPPEVTREVERGNENDPARTWVGQYWRQCEKAADLRTVKSVLKAARSLIDVETPHDQADPYVLALALDLSGDLLVEPCIVTDDRVDKMLRGERKISLTTAAGMHRIPVVPLHALLTVENINTS